MLNFNGHPLAMDPESNEIIVDIVRRAALGIPLSDDKSKEAREIIALAVDLKISIPTARRLYHQEQHEQ